MGEKRRAKRPVVIGVEGLDFLHLLRIRIMNRPEFEGVQLWDLWDSQYSFDRGLRLLLKESVFINGEVRALGIIRDAEADRNAIEDSIKHHMADQGRVRDSLGGSCFFWPPQPVVCGLFVVAEPFALKGQDGFDPRNVPELLASLDSFAESFHAGFGDA
jgi:hypothetical protein